MTLRLLPPIATGQQTITVNGRAYTCAVGSAIDVNDADGLVMTYNGWLRPGTVLSSGPTSARPTRMPDGQGLLTGYTYLDTTLAYVVVYDGAAWRNPATGAAV